MSSFQQNKQSQTAGMFGLGGLRASVARFQDEAHASAVKLQRYSLDSVRTHERAVYLDRENDVLKAEIAVLRANQTPVFSEEDSSRNAQVQELTLSLRRLSQKLSLTEDALLARTTELATAHADVVKTKTSEANAYQLGARVRGREEEGKRRERDLEWRMTKLEEDLKMSDLVVQEYAVLVREMETRSSSTSNGHAGPTRSSKVSEHESSLAELISRFQSKFEDLQSTISSLSEELDVSKAQLHAEKQCSQLLATELGRTKTELEKLQLEDGTASKMVSRYMQFSQTSHQSLLTTLTTLRTRHEATLSTLSSQNHLLSSSILSLKTQNEHLLHVLDELGGEIMRESYGRRKEVAARIRMGGKEERILEGLRRWVRRGEEAMARHNLEQHPVKEALFTLSQEARILLSSLDEGVLDEETSISLSGTLAREVLMLSQLDDLVNDLRVETEKRIKAERIMAGGRGLLMNGNDPIMLEDPPPPRVPEKLSTFKKLSRDDLPSKQSLQSGSVKDTLLEVKGVELADDQETLNENPSEETTTKAFLTSSASSIDSAPLDTSPNTPPIDLAENPTNYLINLSASQPSSSNPDLLRSELDPTAQVPNTQDFSETNDSITFHSSSTDANDITPPPILPPSSSLPLINEKPAQPHPLITKLAKVNKRYDDLQRSFRDCHLAIEGLKEELKSSSSAYTLTISARSSTSEPMSAPANLPSSSHYELKIPHQALSAALTRLDDYTEDVRVELEIKIGDEEVLAKGWEALLLVGKFDGSEAEDEIETNQDAQLEKTSTLGVEDQIEAFVQGTDPAMRRAREAFQRKLDDVMHDISVLKRVLHDSKPFEPDPRVVSASFSTTGFGKLPPSASEVAENTSEGLREGGGWTSWLRHPSSANPTSAPISPPTFGSIMTSPRPRTASSLGSFRTPSKPPPNSNLNDIQRQRKTSFFGTLAANLGVRHPSAHDPLASLGLKVPMPSFGFSPPKLEDPSVGGDGYGIYSPTTPISSPFLAGAPRSRNVSSNLYMLGLSAVVRGPSLGNVPQSNMNANPDGFGQVSYLEQNYQVVSPILEVESGKKDSDDGETDIE